MAKERPEVVIVGDYRQLYGDKEKVRCYAWTLFYGVADNGDHLPRITGSLFRTREEAKADFFAVRNLMNKVSHIK